MRMRDWQAAAEEMAADYKDLTGKDITVMQGTSEDVQAGDFYFALTDDTSMGPMEEGYLMMLKMPLRLLLRHRPVRIGQLVRSCRD